MLIYLWHLQETRQRLLQGNSAVLAVESGDEMEKHDELKHKEHERKERYRELQTVGDASFEQRWAGYMCLGFVCICAVYVYWYVHNKYTHIRVCVQIHTYIQIHIRIYIFYVCTYVCNQIHICTHTCRYVCIYAYICI